MFIKIVIWLLEKSKLSLEEKGMLISSVINKLHALPLRDIIQVGSDGSLVINGKQMDREQIAILRESAKRDLLSKSLAIVRDQVLYEALIFTVKGCTTFDSIYASKMAVWWGQTEQKHLETLAGFVTEEE